MQCGGLPAERRSTRFVLSRWYAPSMIDQPFRWTDPHSWPWIVYVWLAFLFVGWLKPFWQWLQRGQAKSWPTASGRIESATLAEPKRFSWPHTPTGTLSRARGG